MSKCACRDSACKTELRLNSAPNELWMMDKEGKETLMYLDANTIVDLIKTLRVNLLRMAMEET